MMPRSGVEPLDSPCFEELSSITRSLHLREAMASYGKQRLVSHKIVSRYVNTNVKVLWFAPTRPMHENNMYGNVSFTIDWKTAIKHLGPFLYYVDQQENDQFIYSRVLLTNNECEFLTLVTDVDGNRMPIVKMANKHYAATSDDGVKHVLEIGIEVDGSKEKWLYMNCKVQTNNHSSANTLLYPGGPYNSCICHRFNYFQNECPSAYNLQRTRKILEKRCPEMLRDGAGGTSSSGRVIPRQEKQVRVLNYDRYDQEKEEDARSVEQKVLQFSGTAVKNRCISESYVNNQSVSYFSRASHGDTSFSGGVYNRPTVSLYTSNMQKKNRDPERSIVGSVISGFVNAISAGLASIFGNGETNRN